MFVTITHLRCVKNLRNVKWVCRSWMGSCSKLVFTSFTCSLSRYLEHQFRFFIILSNEIFLVFITWINKYRSDFSICWLHILLFLHQIRACCFWNPINNLYLNFLYIHQWYSLQRLVTNYVHKKVLKNIMLTVATFTSRRTFSACINACW